MSLVSSYVHRSKHSERRSHKDNTPTASKEAAVFTLKQLTRPHEATRQRGNRFQETAKRIAHMALRRRTAPAPQTESRRPIEKVGRHAPVSAPAHKAPAVPARYEEMPTMTPQELNSKLIPTPQRLKVPLDTFDSLSVVKEGSTHYLHHGEKTGMTLGEVPVATGKDVYNKLGVNIGSIVGYMDLPGKQALVDETNADQKLQDHKARRIYLVDPWAAVGNERPEGTPRSVALISHSHMEQIIRSTVDKGETPMPLGGYDIPIVQEGYPVPIGRKGWMPYDPAYVAAGRVPGVSEKAYETVSEEQAFVELKNNTISVTSKGRNDTTVVTGSLPHSDIPFDPWPDSLAGTPYDPEWLERQANLEAEAHHLQRQ